MAWLLGLLAGIAALIVGVVVLLLSIVAAMPWLAPSLAMDAATAAPPAVIHIPLADAPAPSVAVTAVQPATTSGNYSMADKFQLFMSLGASSSEAVLLTAICTAENGSGSPTAIGHNKSAPDDVGLCQINASHVPALAPSYQSLEDPVINATVALRMLRSGGPKQWCTYPGGCGGLPGVPNFASLLAQAQLAGGN